MKKQFQSLKLFLTALIMITGLTSYAQQEYTYNLVTTPANIISSKALIDLPGLTGDTAAIIVATPTGTTQQSNPHPTGAWYYNGKWNLFNSDHAPLIVGLTYKVTYFLTRGPNQFLHLVTQQNLGTEGSYIDHPLLNNHSNAQFAFFQNHAPDIRPGSVLNSFVERLATAWPPRNGILPMPVASYCRKALLTILLYLREEQVHRQTLMVPAIVLLHFHPMEWLAVI
jgi:hypothetical protein